MPPKKKGSEGHAPITGYFPSKKKKVADSKYGFPRTILVEGSSTHRPQLPEASIAGW
jgi:hypothetical protein